MQLNQIIYRTCAHKNFVHKNGFVFMEIILAIAVMSVIVAFTLRMTSDQNTQILAKNKAEDFATFQQVAAQYFISNKTDMLAAMADTSPGTSVKAHCVVSVVDLNQTIDPGNSPGNAGTNGTLAWSTTKKTCAFDATLLAAKKVWPAGVPYNFKDVDAGGDARYVAIFKRVVSPGPDNILGNADDVLSDNVEMLVLQMDIDGNLGLISPNLWMGDRDRRMQTETIRSGLGATGGTFAFGDVGWCQSNNTQTNVCGNGWNVNLENFLDSAQLITVRSVLPAPIN